MFRSLAFAFPVVCTAFAITSSTPAVAQTAVRIGPQAAVGGNRPRVVEVQANEPVVTETAAETSDPVATKEPTVLSQAARFALAKREVAERQLARLAPYNLYAQPNEAIYFESDVLPPAQQIRPVRVGAGVQRFQPDSSFSHVLQNALDNGMQAELEYENERLNPPTKSEPRSVEAIAAELQLIEAQEANVQRRMQQLSTLSAATYSSLYRNLADKLELEAYQLQLRRESVEAEIK